MTHQENAKSTQHIFRKEAQNANIVDTIGYLCSDISDEAAQNESDARHARSGILTAYIIDFVGQPGLCPRCDEPLRLESHIFVIGSGENKFCAQIPMGWFCFACPTVVVNGNFYELFELTYGMPPAGESYKLIGFCPGVQLSDITDDETLDLCMLRFEAFAIDSIHPWSYDNAANLSCDDATRSLLRHSARYDRRRKRAAKAAK
ncbi:MAG: hypothetical protein NUW37_20090 [Planctomycetes bacterium]|nr:hypothetical protein [Planctomycetota bacterium]